jgi:hypothetical protein
MDVLRPVQLITQADEKCTFNGGAMKRSVMNLVTVSFVLVFCLSVVQAQNKPDPLKNGFQNPPESARPRVWWHWMNGNISKEGIKLDLEWMHRVGVGGFQNFDAALATPQVVDKRLAYMTPEWKDAFKGSGANSKGEGVTVMIWKKWADDEQVKSHEGSVCRATFRPGM